MLLRYEDKESVDISKNNSKNEKHLLHSQRKSKIHH